MILFENILMALQSLKTNPLRTVLTLVGIAVGIGAVLYVVVLGEITQRNINEQLESLGSNVLMIRPGYSHMHGIRTGTDAVSLRISDAQEIEEYSKVILKTVPIYSGQNVTEYKDNNWTTRITGTSPDYEIVNNEHPAAGRFFTEEEVNRRAQVCVIGATVQEKLFENVPPVGKTILIKSKRFTVIGLLSAKGESWSNPDDQVFIPLTTAQERIFGTDHLNSIYAQMDNAEHIDEAFFDIETILRRNHRLRPDQDNDFRVRRQDLYLSTIQETNKELANFIILIALVSLIVGGIGIANVMLVSVTERIREIGIRRAIGAKKFHILFQFLVESMTLGLFGGIVGIVGGIIFNQIQIGDELILPWNWICYSFFICASIGMIAGMYPALRAANENVIDALRYE